MSGKSRENGLKSGFFVVRKHQKRTKKLCRKNHLWTHNPEVAGSSPVPATKRKTTRPGWFFVWFWA